MTANPSMMNTSDSTFDIVFVELAKARAEFGNSDSAGLPDLDAEELREIDELRRFAMEVATRAPTYHTGT